MPVPSVDGLIVVQGRSATSLNVDPYMGVSTSPTGLAVTVPVSRLTGGVYPVLRSFDRVTWDLIELPDNTTVSGDNPSRYVTCVDDDGTIHAFRRLGDDIIHWSGTTSSDWSDPHIVVSPGGATRPPFHAVLHGPSGRLVLVTKDAAITSSTATVFRFYYSDDVGETWTAGPTFTHAGGLPDVVLLGDKIHFTESPAWVTGSSTDYRRIDVSAMTATTQLVAPSAGGFPSRNDARVMCNTGDPTELTMVRDDGPIGSFQFDALRSYDSGATWPDTALSEDVPWTEAGPFDDDILLLDFSPSAAGRFTAWGVLKNTGSGGSTVGNPLVYAFDWDGDIASTPFTWLDETKVEIPTPPTLNVTLNTGGPIGVLQRQDGEVDVTRDTLLQFLRNLGSDTLPDDPLTILRTATTAIGALSGWVLGMHIGPLMPGWVIA